MDWTIRTGFFLANSSSGEASYMKVACSTPREYCWILHYDRYLQGYACDDNTIYDTRDDAYNACIECGSGCNGVTGIGPATNYVDTWTIRKGTILFDSKFGPGGSNRHEVSYVKESCW